MTSEQVMQTRIAWLLLLIGMIGGCAGFRAQQDPAPRLMSPYPARQVWAVAPLRNESGSLHADGVTVADHLARQLERVSGIDVIPVNRVLAAMEALRMSAVASSQDALKLRQTLGVDALVVGTLSAYDPYDPPKLGLALELFGEGGQTAGQPLNIRELSRAPVDRLAHLPQGARGIEAGQPSSVISVFYDAADPTTRQRLRRYAVGRGADAEARSDEEWRLFRISMDLYTEFVSYEVSSRLLHAETRRLQRESPQPIP